MYISIDSTSYGIPFKIVRRKADMLYKYAERTQDGTLHSELIGVYYNYTVEMGISSNNLNDYQNLWDALTEPVESHTVIVPDEDGTHTFSCYFANISDEVVKANVAGNRVLRNLSFDIIAMSPARTPA